MLLMVLRRRFDRGQHLEHCDGNRDEGQHQQANGIAMPDDYARTNNKVRNPEPNDDGDESANLFEDTHAACRNICAWALRTR